MIFEIVNPSDAATMEADDFEVACIVGVLLGNGMYGLKEIGGDREMPVVAFMGKKVDEWFKSWFGRTMEESADYCLANNEPAVIACLESVLLGSRNERECYQAAIEAIPGDDGRAKFRATWHDKHRSSINDICRYAWKMAERLKATAKPQKPPAEPQEGGPSSG